MVLLPLTFQSYFVQNDFHVHGFSSFLTPLPLSCSPQIDIQIEVITICRHFKHIKNSRSDRRKDGFICRGADEMVARHSSLFIIFCFIFVSSAVLCYDLIRYQVTFRVGFGKRVNSLFFRFQKSHLTPPTELAASVRNNAERALYSVGSEDCIDATGFPPLEESSTKGDRTELGKPVQIKKSPSLHISDKFLRDIVALKAFHALHGHYRVPYYYIIPDEANGDFCTNSRIRRKQSFVQPTSDILPSRSLACIARSVVSEAVEETIVQQNGPGDSVVNNRNVLAPKYPNEVIGLQLGRRVAKIRNGEIYNDPEQRTQLEFLGVLPFNSQIIPTSIQENAVLSININNNGKNAGNNDVASGSKNTLNFLNGSESSIESESNLRGLSSKEYLSEMKFLDILSALKIHDKIFGDMLVPRYFRVPFEEPWPERTWGMQLGNRVRNIRIKSAYNKPKFHEMLHQCGFVMSIDDFRIPFTTGRSHKEE